FVELENDQPAVDLCLRQRELGRIEPLQGVEYLDVAGEPIEVPNPREPDGFLIGGHRLQQLGAYRVEILARDERVRHVTKRAERCWVIVARALFPVGAGVFFWGGKPARREDRARCSGTHAPRVRVAVRELAERRAQLAEEGGQAERRKVRRLDDA